MNANPYQFHHEAIQRSVHREQRLRVARTRCPTIVRTCTAALLWQYQFR